MLGNELCTKILKVEDGYKIQIKIPYAGWPLKNGRENHAQCIRILCNKYRLLFIFSTLFIGLLAHHGCLGLFL